MVLNIRVCGKMIGNMVMVWRLGRMGHFTKANIKWVKNTVVVNLNGTMAPATSENFPQIISTATDTICGQMVASI